MAKLSKLKKAIASVICSAVTVSSMPFAAAPASLTASAAGSNNYMEALALSLYMFDSNACGSGITDGPLTWRGDCHTYDAQASVGSLDGSVKSYVDPDGDGRVDVSGGWHDAGDHIKFNLTIGFGASSLAMSDYLNPGAYEAAGCRDHLIYELKWASDYLMKTTFLNGSGEVAAIAHVVADGGTDHSFWTSPEVQTYDRPVFWLTAGKNNSAVCGEMAAALAGTAYVVKESDPDYASECIKYAKALVSFGEKHVGNDTGGLGDFYSTDAQYQDEMSLAKAWLYILGEGSKPDRTPQRGDYGGSQYDGYLYSWDKVWQGYAALMYKATGDKVFYDELEYELQNQGGLKEGTYNASGWGAARYNCAKQMVAYSLAKGDKDSSYAKGAKYQMDHILGDNSRGYSYLIGYGNKWPTHIHHRAANPGGDGVTSAQNPEAKYTNYGMLVGGDDSSGNYEDHADQYQFTEGALDYNGCFALACAPLVNLYGGDASSVKTIMKNASEINDSFVFGTNSGGTSSKFAAPTFVLKDADTGELISGAEIRITHVTAPADIPLEVSKEYITWYTDYDNPFKPDDFKISTDDVDELYTLDIIDVPKGYKVTSNSYPDGRTLKFTDSSPVEVAVQLKKQTEGERPQITLNISVVDGDTGAYIEGAKVHIDKVLIRDDVFGLKQGFASWNTSDLNPYTVHSVDVCKKNESEKFGYTFSFVQIPDGYEETYASFPDWEYNGDTYVFYEEKTQNIKLYLFKEENPYPDYAVKTDRINLIVNVVDKDTGEYIPNANVVVTEQVTAYVVNGIFTRKFAEWTTLFAPKTISKVRTSVESDPDYGYVYTYYTFSFKDLPEGYSLTEDSFPESIDGKGKYRFDNASDQEIFIYLENTGASVVPGDSNCDGEINMADAVYIMQSLANPGKYQLSSSGRLNADVNGGGVTAMDALDIQKYLLGYYDSLPITPSASAAPYTNGSSVGVSCYLAESGPVNARQCDVYDIECLSSPILSGTFVSFRIVGYNAEERDWTVTFGGRYASATKVIYTGANTFNMLNDSGGDVEVIVHYSDNSTDTLTVSVKNSTGTLPQPMTTGTASASGVSGTTATTTASTAEQPAETTLTYTFDVAVIDGGTKNTVSGVKVKLEEVYKRPEIKGGDKVIFTKEWESSEDENLTVIADRTKGSNERYYFRVTIDELPDGYVLYNTKKTFEIDRFDIANNKDKLIISVVDKTSMSATPMVRVVLYDEDTGKYVKDVDMSIVNISGEEEKITAA